MKRILLTLALSLIVVGAFAQEHLSFKGIPIEGSMTSFCQKLQTKGFTKIGSNNNITMFVGDFTGRQTSVGVASTDDGKNVHSVVVIFDSSNEWNTLVSTYDYYKDLYIRKYGEPSASKENNPSRGDSNTSLMYELLQGRVTWGSVWDVTGGMIELSITKANDYSNGMVVIKYRDAQNVEAKIQNDLNDI
jgi:hypothetical protein